MASDLIIGPLDSDFQDHVLRICQRLGLSDEGNPTFVGSCIRLLNELAKIKEMSPLDVSTTPPTYGDMRNDYRGWFSMSDSLSKMTRSDGFGMRFVMVRRFQSRGDLQ
jgi:hypothetical protein